MTHAKHTVFLPIRETAEHIGVHSDTLRAWRSNGTDPAYVKLIGRIAYRTADVDAWLDSRTVWPDAAA